MAQPLRPTTFYHGTSVEAALAIQEQGFDPERSGSNAGKGPSPRASPRPRPTQVLNNTVSLETRRACSSRAGSLPLRGGAPARLRACLAHFATPCTRHHFR